MILRLCINVLSCIGSNGSASHHPVGHSFHPVSQPGVMQPGVTQPGIAQPGFTQPGVAQPGVAQPGVTQLGITQPGVTQPGIAQLGVAQPRVTQPGVLQPGVTQQRVVQQRAPQLHNAPQHMAAGFQMYPSTFYTILSKFHSYIKIIGFPGVSGYNTAHPPGPLPPNHPVGHSFHPLSQPAGVSAQPQQYMPPGFQMFGKFNLHHLSLELSCLVY